MYRQWKGNLYGIAALVGLLSLNACQTARNLDPEKAEYQEKAGQALGNYTKNLSKTYAITQQKLGRTGGRGFNGSNFGLGGGIDPFGSSIYGGYIAANSIDIEMARCQQMLGGIPRRFETALFRLATLDRCTNAALQYRNPLMSFGYRNLDQFSQYGWGYALNYARPGTFGGFPGSDWNAWSSFAGSGVYRIPAVGF